jgi:hypothetical protein
LVLYANVGLASSKKRSVIKSLRITKELNDYLNNEAEKSNITVSALISSILASYQDRYSQFDKVQPIAIPPPILAPLIQSISNKDLTKIGSIEASRALNYTNHVFNQKNPQDRINYCLEVLMPTSHWFTCIRSKNAYMITHQMGEKWTTFLLSFLSSLVEVETGVKPDLQLDENIIILNLPIALNTQATGS